MSAPEIVFCCEPGRYRIIDEAYLRELAAVENAKLPLSLISYEQLVDGDDPWLAVSHVEWSDSPRLGVYRGWMLDGEHYAALYEALKRRNLFLVNSPEQYRHCHYLPENYGLIAGRTARTIWLPADAGHETVMDAIKVFDGKPLVLKDHVKSLKHFWNEACFIPSSSDSDAVRRVVDRFRALQDPIQGGLVFREHLDLVSVGTHSASGMPLTLEFRVVVLFGEPIMSFPYWDEGDYYVDEQPPLAEFADLFHSIRSRFFTVDLARKRDGSWVIIELGDAQVAGLPDNADPAKLYRALAQALSGENHA